MRADYFSKRVLWMWAFALFFLSVLAFAYWYKWWIGKMHLFWPCLFTTVVGIVIWRSEHRKHLMILTLGLYIVYSLKGIFIDQQIGWGLFFIFAAFGLAVALELFFPDKGDRDWLNEEQGIGEDSSLIMDIGLRENGKTTEGKAGERKSGTD